MGAARSMGCVEVGVVESPWGGMQVVTGPRGLLRIDLPGPFTDASDVAVRAGFGEVVEGGAGFERTARQLAEYFSGARRRFDLRLDLRGTAFDRSVWMEVARVPFGEIRSYGDVARAVDRPTAFRAVGAANGRNPTPIVVPCHRIVGSNGKLTGFGGGLPLKAALLSLEGLTVDDGARVSVPSSLPRPASRLPNQASTNPSRMA